MNPTSTFLQNRAKLHFIDGHFTPSLSGESFATFNPATGTELATLARGQSEDVDLAVAAARRAFEGAWSRFTPSDRAAMLHRIYEVLEANFEELALLETLDIGAPITVTRGRKTALLQTIRYFASLATSWTGTTTPLSLSGKYTAMTVKAPLGVVGAIIPWNAPLVALWWQIGAALATGCTTVVKTAEDASLMALRTAELLVEAGLPPGVVNIVTGFGREAGAALAAHMDVQRLSFTGSTTTGREIIRASANNIKRLQLELGGKSANVVFADADLDRAVPGVAMGVFNNSGQICSAGSRILVQRSIYEEFSERLVAFTKTLRTGDPLDPTTQLGPLVNRCQQDRVLSYAALGREEGATVAVGGNRPGGALENGFYVEPTLFTDAHNKMRISQEEIFGPMASVIPFSTADEAVAIANDTVYGLAGGCWTTDVRTMMKMVREVFVGRLWINCYGVADVGVSFTAHKQSGYGMKAGPEHIQGYLCEKVVYINEE